MHLKYSANVLNYTPNAPLIYILLFIFERVLWCKIIWFFVVRTLPVQWASFERGLLCEAFDFCDAFNEAAVCFAHPRMGFHAPSQGGIAQPKHRCAGAPLSKRLVLLATKTPPPIWPGWGTQLGTGTVTLTASNHIYSSKSAHLHL